MERKSRARGRRIEDSLWRVWKYAGNNEGWRCPTCDDVLQQVHWTAWEPGVGKNTNMQRFVCRRAIGEIAWNRELNCQYFPEGSEHTQLIWWAEGDLRVMAKASKGVASKVRR